MDSGYPGSEEIFHYTSLSGLYGIVQSGEMWATHIKFLNDSDELIHGRELLRRAILGQLQQRPDYDKLSVLVEQTMGQFEMNVFVACFSRLRDDLSQWRGYGGECGVSIGFSSLPMCFAVTYADTPTDNRIEWRARSCIAAIDEFFDRFMLTPSSVSSKNDPGDDDEILAALGKMLRDMHPDVFISSVLVKGESFAAENEMRVVESVPQANLHSRVRFRVARGALLPYVGVSLGPPAPLTRVIVGPNPRADLVADGIRLLLDAHGLSEVPVELSTIPYRG
jgi:hypothetical protein